VARTIVHVDMDAFFASVEQRDDPSLRGRPLAVGGASRRGVVAAASYEARRFGIRSAMPTAQARQLCPQLIVIAPRHGHYSEVSRHVFAIFRRFTPLVEGLSLDEAFLDVSGSHALFGDGERIAQAIRQAIASELHLTASAGVAPCKFVAKIASDMNKPDGLYVVGDDVAGFLAPLPIERMWGVGKVAAARLREAGYRRIGDLAAADTRALQDLLGSWGIEVGQLARGIDPRPVVAGRAAKSIGEERTLERDIRSGAEVEHELLRHCAAVAGRLTDAGLWAQVVRIKIKYADFQLITRQRRLNAPCFDTDSLYGVARELSAQLLPHPKGIRLVGVAAAELGSGPLQQSLFADPGQERRGRVQRVTQELQARFGAHGIGRASLLDTRDDDGEEVG